MVNTTAAAGRGNQINTTFIHFSPNVLKLKPLPDIPDEITPAQLAAWCDSLNIDRAEAAAMVGKASNFWSRLLAGDTDMKLSELNILLKNYAVRKRALSAA